MQPVGPYRFTEALGVCPVGTAWWAIDGQDRLVTVAVLEGAAATDPPWREAFANAANAMAQAGVQRYVNADLAAANPWVAYPSEEGLGAQRLFQTLGMELQPVEAQAEVVVPATGTVSVPPQPVSGPPSPTSGPPHVPWAMTAAVPQQQQREAEAAAPVSPAEPVDAPPADPFVAPARRIQPSAPPPRRTGLRAGVGGLVLLLVALVGGVIAWTTVGDGSGSTAPVTGAAATAFPTASPEASGLKPWAEFAPYSAPERALAVATPSLVFLEVTVSGYLRIAPTNTPLRSTPITFNRRCSGFLINPDGHVLTSSACVKPSQETARQIALEAVAQTMVRSRRLAPAQVDTWVRGNLAKTRYTGVDPGTEPTSQVYAQLGSGRSNLTDGQAIPGQVVDALPADAGNTALVKLAKENLPAVEVNPSATLSAGASMLIVGFSTGDNDSRAASYTPRAKLVTVTDIGRRGSLSTYRINNDVGRTSHGGVALDPSGRVVGMIDQDQARPDRANRVVVPAGTFTGLLDKAGVKNRLGAADTRYRSGLDAYFAGDPGRAVAEFEQVSADSPENVLAAAYRQNAVEQQHLAGRSADRPVWPLMLVAGSAGALLAGLVVLLATLLRRRESPR